MAGAKLQSTLIVAALVTGGAGVAQAQEAQWTGFYLGAHADYLWGDPTTDSTVDFVKQDMDGFGGGAQAGLNYQIDQFLIGLEADITAFDADGEGFSVHNPSTIEGLSVDLDWLATLRARAGVVWDNVLIYGTGGFAWGGGDSEFLGGFAFGNGDLSWSGYAIGGGAEYSLNDAVTVKAEYLYVDLDDEDLDNPHLGLETLGMEVNIVRLGINYNFGTP